MLNRRKAKPSTSRKSKETAQSCGFSDFGGGEWIRTTEVVDNRFTVCPLWPLGNSPINYEVLYKACPAFLSGRTAQFGAGERTRTPDLLITNSVEGVHWEVSNSFWPFLAHIQTFFNPITSNVSTQFFRVWVRAWVKQKNVSGSRTQRVEKPPPQNMHCKTKEML